MLRLHNDDDDDDHLKIYMCAYALDSRHRAADAGLDVESAAAT